MTLRKKKHIYDMATATSPEQNVTWKMSASPKNGGRRMTKQSTGRPDAEGVA